MKQSQQHIVCHFVKVQHSNHGDLSNSRTTAQWTLWLSYILICAILHVKATKIAGSCNPPQLARQHQAPLEFLFEPSQETGPQLSLQCKNT